MLVATARRETYNYKVVYSTAVFQRAMRNNVQPNVTRKQEHVSAARAHGPVAVPSTDYAY